MTTTTKYIHTNVVTTMKSTAQQVWLLDAVGAS